MYIKYGLMVSLKVVALVFFSFYLVKFNVFPILFPLLQR